MDANQTGRFSQGELDLLKATFNDAVLLQVRDHFYQFKSMSFPSEVINLLQKFFNPQLDSDIPLIPQASIYLALSNIREIPPEVAALHILSIDKAVKFLDERLAELAGVAPSGQSLNDLKVSDGKPSDERFTDLLAFQFLVNNWIDSCIGQIRTIVNTKVETPEETAAKAAADSSK